MGTPVRAVSRVRPFIDGETSDGKGGDRANDVAVAPTASQLILGQDNFCDFDAVFGADVSQKELYSACLEDLVQHFWEGYNVSVVGYGGRNSGKTYSITGPGFLWAMNEEEFGLLPRAVRQLYRNIAGSRENEGTQSEVRVSVSYLLLCGDAVYDLLTAQSGLIPLPVLSDHRGSVMVPGLSSVDCNSITEVLNCLEAGLLARHGHTGGAGLVRGDRGDYTDDSRRGANERNVNGAINSDLMGRCKNDEVHNDSSDDNRVSADQGRREGDTGQALANSHASFTITLQQRRVANDGKPFIVCSRLNFVDLGALDEPLPSSGVQGPPCGPLNSSLVRRSIPAGCCYGPDGQHPSAVGSADSNIYSTTDVLGEVGDLMPSSAQDGLDADVKLNIEAKNTSNESASISLDRLYRKDVASIRNCDTLLRRSASDTRNDLLKRKLSAELDTLCKPDNLEEGDEGATTADVEGSVVMTGDHQCLAEVIRCLGNCKHVGAIPYSRSMLTQLLKESLGGNCLTLLVCCASPRREDFPATLLTMKYGGLARYIINRPCINDITHEVAALLADTQVAGGSVGGTGVQPLVGEPRGCRTVDPDVSPTSIQPCNSNAHDNSNVLVNGNVNGPTGTTANANNVAPSSTFNGPYVQQNAFRQALSPEEVFRLQFGSNQLQQLVDAADGILRSCLPFLPVALQTQAGAWLCRRSETAHCLGGPITASHFVGMPQQWDLAAGGQPMLAGPPMLSSPLGGPFYHDGRYWGPVNPTYPSLLERDERTLHVIEELSEPGDLKTSSRNTSSAAAAAAPNAAAYSDAGSSCGSSSSSLGEEFHEQLAVLITSFGDLTSRLVGAVQERLDVFTEFITSADASSEEDDPMTAKERMSVEKMDTERSISSLDLENEESKTSAPSQKETAIEGDGSGANSYQDLHRDLLSDGSSVDERLSSNSGQDSDMEMDSCDSASSASEDDADVEALDDDLTGPRRRNASCSGAGGGAEAVQQLWLAGTSTAAVALRVREANKRRQRELTETIKEKEWQLRSMQRGAAEKEELLRQNRDKLLTLQRAIDRDTIQLAQAERRAQSCRGSAAAVQQLRQALQLHRHRASAIDNFSNIIEATKTPVEEVAKVAARVQELRRELEELHTIVRTGEQRQQQLQHLATHRTRKPQGDVRAGATEDDRTAGLPKETSEDAESPVHPEDRVAPSDAGDSGVRNKVVANTSTNDIENGTVDEAPSAARDRLSTKTSYISSPCTIKALDVSSLGQGKTVADKATVKSRTKAIVSVQGLSQPHKRRLVTSSSEHCSSSGEGDRGEQDPALQTTRLRQEIAALRDARDALVAYRQRLNKKIQKGMLRQSRRWEAERRFMEVDEAVEAVDSSIEYKNELICGRTEEPAASSTLLLRGKLLDRLLNLRLEEIRTLLIRYFSRVIDIRIEFRKQEIAYTELELQFEDQSRLLQKLEWSYEQASLDMERRCAVQQRHFLHYLHKLFRHIDAQETSIQAARETAVPFTPMSAAGDAGLVKCGPSDSDIRQLEMSLYYYKQQCQQLKNLVRQQQGLGYDFQPLYQQLQQQHRHLPHRQQGDDSIKDKTESGKRADISLKLATLGPGASLFSPSRESRPEEAIQVVPTAPEAPALLPSPSNPHSGVPSTSRRDDRHGSVTGTCDQNPVLERSALNSDSHEQNTSVPNVCDTQNGHDRNPFSRNARPQPRMRHRRPPASRSSKYREWSAPKRSDYCQIDAENIALQPLSSQRSSAVAADLRNSRDVPSKWR